MLRASTLFVLAVSITTASADAQTKAPERSVINASSPIVSPKAPRIAFESNRSGRNQLYIIAADGTGERQLTNSAVDVGWAEWLPSGASILYSVAQGDQSAVYEVWPDSARRGLVRRVPGRSPQFSPARDFVLYQTGPLNASRLVIADPRGLDPRTVTSDGAVVGRAVWSPDGRRIAYALSKPSGSAIWVMNYDGSNPHQVTHLTLQQGAAQRPAWSPDGQLLTFQANATTPRVKATLWIIDLKTGGAREVLPHDNSFRDEAPSWFSDGKRLAFQSNRSGRMEVWAVDTDNTDLQQLTGKR